MGHLPGSESLICGCIEQVQICFLVAWEGDGSFVEADCLVFSDGSVLGVCFSLLKKYPAKNAVTIKTETSTPMPVFRYGWGRVLCSMTTSARPFLFEEAVVDPKRETTPTLLLLPLSLFGLAGERTHMTAVFQGSADFCACQSPISPSAICTMQSAYSAL